MGEETSRESQVCPAYRWPARVQGRRKQPCSASPGLIAWGTGPRWIWPGVWPDYLRDWGARHCHLILISESCSYCGKVGSGRLGLDHLRMTWKWAERRWSRIPEPLGCMEFSGTRQEMGQDLLGHDSEGFWGLFVTSGHHALPSFRGPWVYTCGLCEQLSLHLISRNFTMNRGELGKREWGSLEQILLQDEVHSLGAPGNLC